MSETFAEEVERRREERDTKPESCSHCSWVTPDLENYSKPYGGNVGAHWLCVFCRHTQSASALGAGGRANEVVRDMAAMLNVLREELIHIQPERTTE